MVARHSPADFMPELPSELLESHALVGKPMATALLRELAHRRVAIALRLRHDLRAHAFGTILECRDDALALELEPGGPDVGTPPPAGDADYVAVAYLDGVKVQFDASLHHVGADRGRRQLCGEPPLAVYRVQRRDAYRVATATGAGCCVLRRGPGEELSLGIVDLSARGLRLVWQGRASPAIGSIWEHARIEFAGRPPLPCTIVVARIDTRGDGSTLVGCEFAHLPPEIERAVQVLVNDLQLVPRRRP